MEKVKDLTPEQREDAYTQVYPTMNDLREDMVNTACNMTDTKAEARVYIRIMDSMIEDGKRKFEIYETMQDEFIELANRNAQDDIDEREIYHGENYDECKGY